MDLDTSQIADLPADAPVAQADAAEHGGVDTVVASKPLTVGVFDSGIGGFTVAGAILKRRPDVSLVYYADSLNLPYGGRTQDQLWRFAHHSIEFLLTHGVDLLAVGCNASNSALGSSELRSYGVPVFDLVGSTIDSLRAAQRQREHVAILATEATVRSGYWERKLADAFPALKLTSIAAPELVPLIEAPRRDEAAIRAAVGRYAAQVREAGADTLLYGCTHYPLLQSHFVDADALLAYIDPAQCLADRLVASLPEAQSDAPAGNLQFFNSLPSERFYSAGELAFGRPIRGLTRMYIVNPYEE